MQVLVLVKKKGRELKGGLMKLLLVRHGRRLLRLRTAGRHPAEVQTGATAILRDEASADASVAILG